MICAVFIGPAVLEAKTIKGTDQDDQFFGVLNEGNLTFRGGPGRDSILMVEPRSAYTLVEKPNRKIYTHITSKRRLTIMNDVEVIEFEREGGLEAANPTPLPPKSLSKTVLETKGCGRDLSLYCAQVEDQADALIDCLEAHHKSLSSGCKEGLKDIGDWMPEQ